MNSFFIKHKHHIAFIVPSFVVCLTFFTCLGFYYHDPNTPYNPKDILPEISDTARWQLSNTYYDYRVTFFAAGLSTGAVLYGMLMFMIARTRKSKTEKWTIRILAFIACLGLYGLAAQPPQVNYHLVHFTFASIYFLSCALLVNFLTWITRDGNKIIFWMRTTWCIILWVLTLTFIIVPFKGYARLFVNESHTNLEEALHKGMSFSAAIEWVVVISEVLMIGGFGALLKGHKFIIDFGEKECDTKMINMVDDNYHEVVVEV